MPDRDNVLIDALLNDSLSVDQIRGVISHLRTLGYIGEVQYSRLNTALSRRTNVVRRDGSETIELARDHTAATAGDPRMQGDECGSSMV